MTELTRELTTTNGAATAVQSTETEMRNVYTPKVDIVETGSDVILFADMPGVDEDSVDITLEKNVLTINGYSQVDVDGEFSLAYAEYRPGNFQRTFNLADGLDHAKIEATMKNGVLRLVLPKTAEVKARRITVKGE